MTKMRKIAAATVLGLFMCMALFTTGAFAQSAWGGHGVFAASVAVAGTHDGFFGGNGCGFGCGFGCGCFSPCWGGCFDPCFGGGLFGGGGAFAASAVLIH